MKSSSVLQREGDTGEASQLSRAVQAADGERAPFPGRCCPLGVCGSIGTPFHAMPSPFQPTQRDCWVREFLCIPGELSVPQNCVLQYVNASGFQKHKPPPIPALPLREACKKPRLPVKFKYLHSGMDIREGQKLRKHKGPACTALLPLKH